MKKIKKRNFFLFSGRPGAGKTTVIEQLKQQGYIVVAEVARDIIRHQRTIGGKCHHDGDRLSYTDLMLQKSIDDFEQRTGIEELVFFDRGLPDLYSYSKRFCGGATETIKQAIEHYRYNRLAFIFPPWPEIYCHDAERKQSINEAMDTWDAVMEGYQDYGYIPIEVPKVTIAERVQFILTTIRNLTNV